MTRQMVPRYRALEIRTLLTAEQQLTCALDRNALRR
jgi:hypothetical protein